jgi:hypothetical protein
VDENKAKTEASTGQTSKYRFISQIQITPGKGTKNVTVAALRIMDSLGFILKSPGSPSNRRIRQAA